jgi:hypothetical protein
VEDDLGNQRRCSPTHDHAGRSAGGDPDRWLPLDYADSGRPPPNSGPHGKLLLPVTGDTLTQGYGCTPFALEPGPPFGTIGHFRSGLDLAAPLGTPVRATDGGEPQSRTAPAATASTRSWTTAAAPRSTATSTPPR